LLQWCYARLRAREGIGFGDIKLAAAVGAWLPVEAIPLCFGLASGAALVAVLLARLRGEAVDAFTKVPFGAFLCPALWLVFYGASLSN
jgi:leader peptidase (prepilin peptidase)/N-methyltransferase